MREGSATTANNNVPEIQIESLCDVVPNRKRTATDFQRLLRCLELRPKDCIPLKGKILQHLLVHGLENPTIDIRLLSACFARATILFRKTPNKSEGPVGAWKTGLLDELRTLEENLNELYTIVGIKTSNIIGKSNAEDYLEQADKLDENVQGYEGIIDEHLARIRLASHNICALVSIKTDFDLPIPVHVIVRMSAKIGLLRWRDYKKKPNGPMRSYVFSLTPQLINLSLTIFRYIVVTLGTNLIPFTPFLGQTVARSLEWTRTSGLSRHDEKVYHKTRISLLQMVSFMVEQLALNLNLEPSIMKCLIEVELVNNLEDLEAQETEESFREKHMLEAMGCLENLFTIYSSFLDAQLENRVKSYVIQSCIKIFRDFESSKVSAKCRCGLLRLLKRIADQPHATPTTEIAHHIFELANRFETDPEIRVFARRTLQDGLAHRPTIVTHYEVYKRVTEVPEFIELSNGEKRQSMDAETEASPAKAATTIEEVPMSSVPDRMEASNSPVIIEIAESPIAVEAPKDPVVAETVGAQKVIEISDNTPSTEDMETEMTVGVMEKSTSETHTEVPATEDKAAAEESVTAEVTENPAVVEVAEGAEGAAIPEVAEASARPLEGSAQASNGFESSLKYLESWIDQQK